MTSNVTFVSAFFDLGRGDWSGDVCGRPIDERLQRSPQQYLDWFRNLAFLRNDLVIFTEPQFVPQISESRRRAGLENRTKVVVCEKLFGPDGILRGQVMCVNDRMCAEFHQFVCDPTVPEYWNAEYVVLQMLKSVFVRTAIDLEFDTHGQLAWIDFGYCRNEDCLDRTFPWQFECGSKMHLFYVREPDVRPIFEIVRTGDVYFQGSIMCGGRDAWRSFGLLMDEAFRSLLACDLVDDDQTVMLVAYRRRPEAFCIHPVDPGAWFSGLTVYNQRATDSSTPARRGVDGTMSVYVSSTSNLGDFLNSLPVISGLARYVEKPLSLIVTRGMRKFYGLRELLLRQKIFRSVSFDDETDVGKEQIVNLSSWTRYDRSDPNRPIETCRYENWVRDNYKFDFDVDDNFELDLGDSANSLIFGEECDIVPAGKIIIGDRWSAKEDPSLDTRRRTQVIRNCGKFNEEGLFYYLDYNRDLIRNLRIIKNSPNPFVTTFTGIGIAADLMRKDLYVLWDEDMRMWDGHTVDYDFSRHYYANRNGKLEFIREFDVMHRLLAQKDKNKP